MCSELPLGLSADFPLQRWLRNAEAKVSGYVLLAGNASAHERALECQLRETARDRPELLQIASRSAWHHLSCADGCPSLADDVARLMRERTGRWSVVLVQAAERAQPSAINPLVARFWQQARCVHPLEDGLVEADCRRTLFALSTSFGAEVLLATPEVRARSRASLQQVAAREAAAWFGRHDALGRVPQRLRASLCVVLGEEPRDLFASLMAEQDEARGGVAPRGCDAPGTTDATLALAAPTVVAAAASGPDHSVFERMAGQEAVVEEVRARLKAVERGADGGEDARTEP